MVGTLPIDLESVKGGVEAAILNLFYGFSLRNDIEVVHLSFVEGLENRREVSFSSNIRIHFIPFKVRFKLLDYFVNRSELKKIVSSAAPDIIHIQESEPHLLRFLSFSKQNIVVTQHGIMREELKYANGLGGKLKFLFKSAVERYVFPLFKNVIFISDYNKRLFRGKLDKSVNIYNAVNPLFFNNDKDLKADGHSIAYVGVINRRKNLKIVIQALHALKSRQINYTLHVVGWYKDNDSAYESEIMGLIKQYEISSQVKFHGWLKQKEILSVFDQCGSFVLPSLQETLPISIAEAMALGKIVIATDVGAISEMFQDKKSGYLFRKNDHKNLVDLLEFLHHNQQAEKEVSKKAAEIAIDKYHPAANAGRTIDFYKSVMIGNPKGQK